MKHNVNITVVQSATDGKDDEGFCFKGRLLGACSEQEAIKIASNWPVAERIYTSCTKTLKNTALALDDIIKSTEQTGTGNIIVALTAMGYMEADALKETYAKHLMVTAPVIVFSEDPAKDGKSFSLTLECTDGSLITIEELTNE